MKEKIVVEIEVNNTTELAQAARALSTVAEKIPIPDMVKLANAISRNPGLVKKALMFI